MASDEVKAFYDSLTIKISFSIVIDNATTCNELLFQIYPTLKCGRTANETKNRIELMMQRPKIDNQQEAMLILKQCTIHITRATCNNNNNNHNNDHHFRATGQCALRLTA